jgi:hypothetical protein
MCGRSMPRKEDLTCGGQPWDPQLAGNTAAGAEPGQGTRFAGLARCARRGASAAGPKPGRNEVRHVVGQRRGVAIRGRAEARPERRSASPTPGAFVLQSAAGPKPGRNRLAQNALSFCSLCRKKREPRQSVVFISVERSQGTRSPLKMRAPTTARSSSPSARSFRFAIIARAAPPGRATHRARACARPAPGPQAAGRGASCRAAHPPPPRCAP